MISILGGTIGKVGENGTFSRLGFGVGWVFRMSTV